MRLPDLQPAPLPSSHQRRTQIRSQEKSAASSVISSGYRQHKPTRRSLDTLLDTEHHDPFNKQAMRDLREQLRSKLDAARALGDPERTKVDVQRLIQLTTRFMLLTDPELAAAAAAATASGHDSGPGVSTSALGSPQRQQQSTQVPPAATVLLKARRMSRVGGFVGPPPPPGIAASTTSSHTSNSGSPTKAPNWSQEQAHIKFMSAVESCVSHATPREMQTDALRKHRKGSCTFPVNNDPALNGLSAEHEASTVVHVLDSKGQVRTIARYAATVEQVRQSPAVAAIAARRAARGGSTPDDHSVSLQKQVKKGRRGGKKQVGLHDSDSDETGLAPKNVRRVRNRRRCWRACQSILKR
ncbi:hypothetical protein BCR44DRAFT_1259730 [Catenaria anguillulae PL171]|uniref:Uncharacterized protein n=1 Tax=Catenaria anguillulae PL171 TaxID=765915 RepID=A0A1Y2HFM7_9FUNG|nr:hypothetical protein BCR44DRAFT_1259730 [Catenaria anguillulae PL171]